MALLVGGIALMGSCAGTGAARRSERPGGPAGPRALEPDPDAAFTAAAAEATRLVPDPARGGPPLVALASPLPPFAGVGRATARYVGEATCAGCHADAAARWTGTAHASALDTLVAANASHRPDCVRCHVTGYLQPGGEAAGLAGVQCEACHGPGSDHVAGVGAGAYGALPGSLAACVACHTWETAPDFAYPAAWTAVRHGGDSSRHN